MVDPFSTKCAENGLFYFDLVSEDLPWRLIRVSVKNREVRTERDFKAQSGQLPHSQDQEAEVLTG